jgi:hypothetical protein
MIFKSTFQAQFLRRSGPIKVGLKDAGLNDWAWTSYTPVQFIILFSNFFLVSIYNKIIFPYIIKE